MKLGFLKEMTYSKEMIVFIYLLRGFFRRFVIVAIGCILGLTATRAPAIGNFLSLSPDGYALIAFLFYQIIYIIPIALPISCLVATALTIADLQRRKEWVLLRTSGLSLPLLFLPFFFSSCIMAALCFCAGEMASQGKALRRGLLHQAAKRSPVGCFLHASPIRNTVWWSQQREGEFQILGKKGNEEFFLSGGTSRGEENLGQCTLIAFCPTLDFPEVRWSTYCQVALEEGAFNRISPPAKCKPNSSRFLALFYQAGGLSEKECQHEMLRRVALACAPLSFTWLGFCSMLRGRESTEKTSWMKIFIHFFLFFLLYFYAKLAKVGGLWGSILFFAPHATCILSGIRSFFGRAKGSI
ncbi:MAG: LptF/LptG family permease [Chlamydiota bacterium]